MSIQDSYIDTLPGGRASQGGGRKPPATDRNAGRAQPTRLPWRLRGLLVAGLCWAAIAAAALMTPDPTGSGTHRQLGLPGCGFLQNTGWPCPSCGMTTSLAAMAHGRVVLAWTAQPFGVVLFAFTALMAAMGTAELIAGRDLIGRLRPTPWWALIAIVGLLAGWGGKCLMGYLSGAYPR